MAGVWDGQAGEALRNALTRLGMDPWPSTNDKATIDAILAEVGATISPAPSQKQLKNKLDRELARAKRTPEQQAEWRKKTSRQETERTSQVPSKKRAREETLRAREEKAAAVQKTKAATKAAAKDKADEKAATV
eukprot:scaffold6105_cov75-Phaeocystis_antarctica.AAC.3